MPNRRLTDDDIVELYRRSSLNPGRFTARFYEGLDYVTSRRFARRLGLAALGLVAVLTVNWLRRWLTNAGH